MVRINLVEDIRGKLRAKQLKKDLWYVGAVIVCVYLSFFAWVVGSV